MFTHRKIVLGFVLLFANVGQGALIQPDSVTPSSEFSNGGFDARAIHTIDGSGLPAGFGIGDAHADYASGNH